MSTTAEPIAIPATMGSSKPSSAGEIRASTMMGRAQAPAATAKPATATTAPTAPAAPAAKASPAAPAAPAAKPPAKEGAIQIFDDGKKASTEVFEGLRKLAKDPSTPEEAVKPAAKKGESKPVEGAEPAEGEIDPATGKPIKADSKKKVNPWDLLKENKKIIAEREAEIADFRKLVANPEARKSELERISKVEKRNQELEEQIKFVDYSKSTEFQEKYQKPYESAWTRAMSELKELTVEGMDGTERPMQPKDLLELVNLPLKEAREKAEELYGSAADDVMNYRKEIKSLYQAQNDALDQARKSGVEKHSKDSEAHQQKVAAAQKEANEHWQSVNKAIVESEASGQFFKPIDGDEEGNKILESGYKFVDDTMALNPMDPNLTAEQRKEAVKRHAWLRAGAAAFPRLRKQVEALKAELKQAATKLAEFEGSEPELGGEPAQASASGGGGSAMASVMGELRKKAKG